MPGKEIKGRSIRANYRYGGRIKAADGLWANIHAKKARIKAGSGEKMKTMMNQSLNSEKLDQNEELAELRADTSLEKQEMANKAREKLAMMKPRRN